MEYLILRYVAAQKNHRHPDAEGFTLAEMLTVLIIIGVLAAVALPSFLNQANKARESEAAVKIGAINHAQQAFYLEERGFATALETLELGIAPDTPNYSYRITTTDDEALATASPTGALKGYAGRVWTVATEGGNVTNALLCTGKPGQVPALSELSTCPDNQQE